MMTALQDGNRMHRRGRRLCVVGWAIFALSLLMPAFYCWDAWASGWDCFRFVYEGSVPFSRDGVPIYWRGFAVANAVMIASAAFLWWRYGDRRSLRCGSLALAFATLYVASWVFWTARDGSLRDVGPGYYAWLLSFGLVTAGVMHLSVRRRERGSGAVPKAGLRTAEELAAIEELDAYLNGNPSPVIRRPSTC